MIVNRGLAAILAALTGVGPALADVGESALWREARPASTRVAPPAARRPDAFRLFQNLPRPQSTSLSPSIAQQLSRFKSPELRQRLVDVVSALPAQAGDVREVAVPAAAADGRVVIHIQDVHLNTEAQENIAAAIRELSGKDIAGVVALEGAFEPVKLEPFREFSDRAAMRDVAAFLLRENKISGPVSAGMTEARAPAFAGVDSRAHYNANVAAYIRAAPLQAENREKLRERERVLAETRRQVFSPELLRFDEAVAAFEQGRAPMGVFIRALTRQAVDTPLSFQTFLSAYEIESRLDFAQVEAERARLLSALVQKLERGEIDRLVADSLDYRAGRMGHGAFYARIRDLSAIHGVAVASYPSVDAYIRYVLLTDAIRPGDLYRDIDVARAAVFKKLATTPRQSALVAESERLRLAGKLISFSLTPEEWEKFRGEPRASLGFLTGLAFYEAFYAEAEARNDSIAANLLSEMERLHARVGVLVTGGFHAPGVGARLSRAGVATVSYVPRLTKTNGDGAAYLSVFARDKEPLDRFFEGTKNFLAEAPAAAASLNRAAMLGMVAARLNNPVGAPDLTDWFLRTTGFAALDRLEALGDDTFRVIYRRIATSEPTSILVSRTEDGFTIDPDTAFNFSSRARALTLPLTTALAWLQALMAGSLSEITGVADRNSAFSRPLLNSTFVVAPLITFALVAFLGVFGPVGAGAIAALYLLTKASLFVSIVLRQTAHLLEDQRFDNLGWWASVSLSLSTLNRGNLWRAFLLGTDMTNAFVVATPREAARNDVETERALRLSVRFVLAGPVANLALLGAVTVALFSAATLGLAEATQALAVEGGILALVNLLLLVNNGVLVGRTPRSVLAALRQLMSAPGRIRGEDVTIANRELTVVAQNGDQERIADLLRLYPDQKTTALIDAGFEASLRRRFAAAIASGRLTLVISEEPLFSTDDTLDVEALEAALGQFTEAQRSRMLLLISNRVRFDAVRDASRSSLLRNIAYRALEDLLAGTLIRVRVIPLGTAIELAKSLAVQA